MKAGAEALGRQCWRTGKQADGQGSLCVWLTEALRIRSQSLCAFLSGPRFRHHEQELLPTHP